MPRKFRATPAAAAMGQRAKARRDCLDRQMRQRRDSRRGHHGDQHAGPIRPIAPDQEDQRRRARPTPSAAKFNVGMHAPARPASGSAHRAPPREPEAAKILELACQDRDRNAGSETDRNRMRNMPDERAEPQAPIKVSSAPEIRTVRSRPFDDRTLPPLQRPAR